MTATASSVLAPARAAALLTALVGLAISSLACPATAQTLGASVGLLDGGQGEDGRYLAGIEVDLDPGWKTYWRMPGKGGLPPGFDWSASENVAETRVLWPAPHRLEDAYGDSIGYDARVVFPVEVTPIDPEAEVRLAVTGLIGVCERVCVPLDIALDSTLDPDATPGRLTRFVEAVPRPATEEERAAVTATLSEGGETLAVEADLAVTDLFATGETVANGLSERQGERYAIAMSRRHAPGDPVTLTVLTPDGAFDLPLE